MKNSIFDILNKNNVCYAVISANVCLRKTYDVVLGYDYLIVALYQDVKKVPHSKTQDFVSELTLKDYEVDEFKDRLHLGEFKKVYSDKYGVAYELPNKSFKEYKKSKVKPKPNKQNNNKNKVLTK